MVRDHFFFFFFSASRLFRACPPALTKDKKKKKNRCCRGVLLSYDDFPYYCFPLTLDAHLQAYINWLCEVDDFIRADEDSE